jgi:hypothetical protein
MSEHPETGLSRLEAAVRDLDALDQQPVERHPAAFDAVHHAMREVLAGAHDA